MPSIARRLTRRIEIPAGGRAWQIVFTHRVLLDIGDLTGRDPMKLSLGRLSAQLLRAVLFAVLRDAGAPFSLEQAGSLLRAGDVAVIRSKLVDAWMAAMPEPDPEEEQIQTDVTGRVEPPLTAMRAWAEARYDLRLSDEEWLDMTPRMVQAVSQRRLRDMRWHELMMSVHCAYTVNHSYRAPKTPAEPRQYMLHPWPETPLEPVYGETIMLAMADIPKATVH